MRNMLLSGILLTMLQAGTLEAGPINFSIYAPSPPGNLGQNYGVPGQIVDWGFDFDNTYITDWVSVTSVSLSHTNLSVFDSFTDYMGPQGGPNIATGDTVPFYVAAGTDWSENSDFNSQQGVGAYLIAPNALIWSADTGNVTVNYELFSGDPGLGGIDLGSFFVDAPLIFGQAYEYEVEVIPEPATSVLGFLGLALLAAHRRSKSLALRAATGIDLPKRD
jgi:hypothetical protein